MLSQLRAQYETSLFESVLPFWMKHSIDPEHGGFFSCLDREGAIYDPRKYVWMNGRQVWMLSRLYNTAEGRPEWLDAARGGAEFLRKFAFDDQGRCWFSLTASGEPAGFQRKPYGAVFVQLGFDEYAKASGDPAFQSLADELYARIRTWIANPTLLGRPALPGAPRLRSLADLYVFLFMGLQRDDDALLQEALSQVPHFFTDDGTLLYENAPVDAAAREFPEGRLISVGSVFEVAWLVLRALERHPDDALAQRILNVIEGAWRYGWDPQHGGLFYFQDLNGRPPAQLEWDMKLWWVHVEAMLAFLVAYQRTADEKWLRYLEELNVWIWQCFPDRTRGEWFGYLSRNGEPSHLLKGGAYKGCFHIPRALWFSLQILRDLLASSQK